MLYTLEAGDCLFCVQFIEVPEIYGNVCGDKNCFSLKVTKIPRRAEKARKFLKDSAFSQSKSDKISGMGRESVRILEKNSAFSQSKSDKNSRKGRESMEILERQGFFSV